MWAAQLDKIQYIARNRSRHEIRLFSQRLKTQKKIKINKKSHNEWVRRCDSATLWFPNWHPICMFVLHDICFSFWFHRVIFPTAQARCRLSFSQSDKTEGITIKKGHDSFQSLNPYIQTSTSNVMLLLLLLPRVVSDRTTTTTDVWHTSDTLG